jgi:predicted acylesterase/phospholipase RssA
MASNTGSDAVAIKFTPPVSSSSDRRTNPDVKTATEVLDGATALGLESLKSLVRKLKTARYFDLARQIAEHGRSTAEVAGNTTELAWFAQQQALCTYKDPDLPADHRLDKALAILRSNLQLDTTKVQETLGLAGGIFKRKWEIDGQSVQLERALAYYRRGYQQGFGDDGYTGINAAFVLDLLAAQEDQVASELGVESSGAARRAEAKAIREAILANVTPKPNEQVESDKAWFKFGTLGEAAFALGHDELALEWLRRALAHKPSDWEFETTARQFAQIARLRSKGADDHPAWDTLRQFLGNDATAANSVKIGKLGLSLSGGGFRASLFHIGVLARLAECDLLRHVEVLSCVSGGSIVGAHYYLEVRHLLRTKADGAVTSQDYVEIVERVADEFLAGIQQNIRCRLMSATLANLKMALFPDYTSTRRLGELYEEQIYARVADKHTGERWLNDLLVQPEGATSEFNPKLDNWRRRAKVPILILNATALNTGHNWQFTASWMGETPAGVTSDIEANDRFRRLYYWQAPPEHQKVRLGHAVAASACVPGLFEPLALSGLYPERVVHLVDGGVHDNQGIAGLLEQDCTILLVSDAAGQMQTVRKPRSELHELLGRMISILMGRVRDAEYREIAGRRRISLLRGLMYLHLKNGLDLKPVDWIDARAPHKRAGSATGVTISTETGKSETHTPYGIDKKLQEQIAAIRTDLDSFNDTEAFALMTSGYLMTRHELPAALKDVRGLSANAPTRAWRFLDVQKMLEAEDAPDAAGKNFGRLLTVGCSTLGKHFRLAPALSTIVFATSVAILLVAVAAVWCGLRPLFPSAWTVGWTAALAGFVLAIWIGYLFRMRQKSITQFVFGLLYALFGWFAWVHLLITDPHVYLRLGRREPQPGDGRGTASTPEAPRA